MSATTALLQQLTRKSVLAEDVVVTASGAVDQYADLSIDQAGRATMDEVEVNPGIVARGYGPPVEQGKYYSQMEDMGNGYFVVADGKTANARLALLRMTAAGTLEVVSYTSLATVSDSSLMQCQPRLVRWRDDVIAVQYTRIYSDNARTYVRVYQLADGVLGYFGQVSKQHYLISRYQASKLSVLGRIDDDRLFLVTPTSADAAEVEVVTLSDVNAVGLGHSALINEYISAEMWGDCSVVLESGRVLLCANYFVLMDFSSGAAVVAAKGQDAVSSYSNYKQTYSQVMSPLPDGVLLMQYSGGSMVTRKVTVAGSEISDEIMGLPRQMRRYPTSGSQPRPFGVGRWLFARHDTAGTLSAADGGYKDVVLCQLSLRDGEFVYDELMTIPAGFAGYLYPVQLGDKIGIFATEADVLGDGSVETLSRGLAVLDIDMTPTYARPARLIALQSASDGERFMARSERAVIIDDSAAPGAMMRGYIKTDTGYMVRLQEDD